MNQGFGKGGFKSMRKLERNLALVEEDKKVISPASRVPYYPLVVDHAQGSTVVDADGNEYLDFKYRAFSSQSSGSH